MTIIKHKRLEREKNLFVGGVKIRRFSNQECVATEASVSVSICGASMSL